MESSSSPQHRSPEQEERPRPNKIFVTNLEVDIVPTKLEQQLTEKFSRYGKLDSVMVKKSFNNEYSFAFIEYKEGEDATPAVNQLNNTSVCGKKMKVELQDNARRRKGGYQKQPTKSQSCYVCGKVGHYARNCRQQREKERESRSDSESRPRRHHKKDKKKKHHRHRSSSSDNDARRRKCKVVQKQRRRSRRK